LHQKFAQRRPAVDCGKLPAKDPVSRPGTHHTHCTKTGLWVLLDASSAQSIAGHEQGIDAEGIGIKSFELVRKFKPGIIRETIAFTLARKGSDA